MGKIQGAALQSLAAGAAVAAGADKAIQSAQLDEEQGLLAQEQYHEASADLTKLTGESEAAGKELSEKQAISDALANKKPGGKGNTKAALNEKRAAALSEVEAAQRAFDELADRIEAKKAMMSRAEKIMKRTNTWGGVR